LSKPLLEITEAGFRPRNIFWLTTRIDTETAEWASKSYISAIRYFARSESDHAAHISELVTDCLSYSSLDKPEPPLEATQTTKNIPVDEINPDALAQEAPEIIRLSVSALLDKRLRESKEETVYSTYRTFCDEYDYAVHRGFYKAKATKFKKWFGYELDFPALGRGNFGEVFSRFYS